ncbi:D-alanine--D-alanine ligase [Fundidesulfovibrio butyratiphilus]
MNILLIAGGWSSEREVSLAGAAQIEEALKRLGHTVTRFDPLTDFDRLTSAAAGHDFAFINLHGQPGEDGLIQAMLNACGLPYQGSGPEPSFLALNKACAKQVFRANAIATPDWRLLIGQAPEGWVPDFAFPVFVKPNTGGSSVGMSLVKTPQDLPAALELAFSQGREVLVEPAVDGPEVTCAVLGDRALPPILIKPKVGVFFDYDSKYAQGGADEICPAPLPSRILQAVEAAALAAHKALGLTGYSRSDFMLQGETPLILEVNTLPGMTATSLIPKSAKATGMDFDALVAKLVALGLEERRKPAGNARNNELDL